MMVGETISSGERERKAVFNRKYNSNLEGSNEEIITTRNEGVGESTWHTYQN
jgi:hypothetical protein